VCLFVSTAQRANAVDANPRDYVPAPVGTHSALFYYYYGNHRSYVNQNGNDVPDSELISNVMVARYVEYFEYKGMVMNWNVVQVFGGFNSAKVGDADLSHNGFQLGDTALVYTLYPVNKPEKEMYVAIANHLILPTGSHDSDTDLNLGGNRWSVTVQPGFYISLFGKWSAELLGDISIYGDNTDGPGGATVKEDPSFTAITWLNYATPSPGSNAAVGVTATKYGDKTIGGVAQDGRYSIAIRAAYTHMLNPTTQLVMEVSHDVAVKNTFEKDIGVLLRFSKAL